MKKKEKKYGLLKAILIVLVVAFLLSWLIPNGTFINSGFTDGGMKRLGFDDLAWSLYYGLYYCVDKITLLLVIGGMYGVLSKTKAYESLVSSLAKKIKWKKVFVVVISVVIAGLASILNQPYALIVFIPFIASVMKRMGLDKITILATTFGSILIGTMGATYGTEGVLYLNEYLTNTFPTILKDTVLVRAGILLVGLVLFNFFNLMHVNKLENSKSEEEVEDIFPIEVQDKNKSNTIIPIVITGIVFLVVMVLGYVNWYGSFGIEMFHEFHESLTSVEIGEGFFILKDILGSNIFAFGEWELVFSMASMVIVFTIILALCYKVKLDDFITNYISGMKKVLKPIACVVAAWMLLAIVYMSPYVATILNKLISLTDGFNLATMTLAGLVTNIFHTDLGFTGYIFNYYGYLSTEFVDYINPIYVIFVSLYGFVQLFIPTSAVLGIGLTSLNVKYKDWLKYIWKFILGMFICLLVIFILITIV